MSFNIPPNTLEQVIHIPKKFGLIPLTVDELEKWNKEPSKNPRTDRKISLTGNLHKYISNEYNKYKNIKLTDKDDDSESRFIKNKKFKLDDSIDDKDPVTLNQFWIMKEGNKEIVYDGKLEDLIFYKDSHNLIRCFEKETVSYLKAHKITKNPVSQEEIPKELFDMVEEKNLEEERKNMTVNEKALEIFQKFSKISIFIDSEWFLELSKDKLKKFNYEASSFYKENLTLEQRKLISPEPRLNKKESELDKMELKDVQLYILNEIDILLEVQKEEIKYMINYILIGALGIVIPEIKELYPDFSFAFNAE